MLWISESKLLFIVFSAPTIKMKIFIVFWTFYGGRKYWFDICLLWRKMVQGWGKLSSRMLASFQTRIGSGSELQHFSASASSSTCSLHCRLCIWTVSSQNIMFETLSLFCWNATITKAKQTSNSKLDYGIRSHFFLVSTSNAINELYSLMNDDSSWQTTSYYIWRNSGWNGS